MCCGYFVGVLIFYWDFHCKLTPQSFQFFSRLFLVLSLNLATWEKSLKTSDSYSRVGHNKYLCRNTD